MNKTALVQSAFEEETTLLFEQCQPTLLTSFRVRGELKTAVNATNFLSSSTESTPKTAETLMSFLIHLCQEEGAYLRL